MRSVWLLFLTCVGSGAAAQAPVYKCVGTDMIPSYVSARRAGETCEIVSVAHDKRWHHITSSVDGDMVRVDLDTLVRGETGVSAWVQYIHAKSGAYVSGRRVFRTLNRDTFNCAQVTVATASYATYAEDGTVIDSGTYLSAMPRPVVPDSVQEAVWQWACRTNTE